MSLALLALAFSVRLQADPASEVLSEERRVSWQREVGSLFSVERLQDARIYSARNYGARGTGRADDWQALTEAIHAAQQVASPSEPVVVYLPAGRYLLRNTLRIPSGVVLRGDGAQRTELLFDFGGKGGHCIMVAGSRTGAPTALRGGLQKGSTELLLESTEGLRSGMLLQIAQENDPDLLYTRALWYQRWGTDWAPYTFVGAVGQVTQVVQVRGNRVIVDPPLHFSFDPDRAPRCRSLMPVVTAGLEDLAVRRVDPPRSLTFSALVYFLRARDCWMKRVESSYCYHRHVVLEASLRVAVLDSYFHHAHVYGSGKGYGVALVEHATNCLIENNVFYYLTDAVVLQVGPSGNVIAYNFSTDPPEETASWASTNDVSLHGYYPFMNLFEGNVFLEIDVADYWGPAGPGNTFFRNRVDTGGIDVRDHSHKQNLVANELPRGGSNRILISSDSHDVYRLANTLGGAVDVAVQSSSLPASFYLAAKPNFFGSLPYPPFGPDTPQGAGTIPAEQRFLTQNPIPGPRAPAPQPEPEAEGPPSPQEEPPAPQEETSTPPEETPPPQQENQKSDSPAFESPYGTDLAFQLSFEDPSELDIFSAAPQGVVSFVQSQRGQVLSVEGQGYVELPCEATWTPGGAEALSLCLWVHVGAVDPTDHFDRIVMVESRPQRDLKEAVYLNACPGSGEESFRFCFGLRTDEDNTYQVCSSTYPLSERWHHIAATAGSEALRLYVDGRLVAERTDWSGATVAANQFSGARWLIGSGEIPRVRAFHGMIDDVLLLKRSLSAQEVRELFLQQGGKLKPPRPKAILVRW